MAYSRLSVLFTQIGSLETVAAEEIIPAEKKRETPGSPLGTWSDINFYKLSNVSFAYHRKEPPAIFEQPAEIVISKFKPARSSPGRPLTAEKLQNMVEQIKVRKWLSTESFELLQRKNISLNFNMGYLAFGSDGTKITSRGYQDLYDFIFTNFVANQSLLTRENVKRLIGHLMLAVFAIHNPDCAHRDIKHENFIVYKIDGKIFPVLGDHSDMVDTFRNGRAINPLYTIAGTFEFTAPELEECGDLSDYVAYQELDLKAIDCYALGETILQLVEKVFLIKDNLFVEETSQEERATFEEDEELKPILELCRALKGKVEDRPNIVQAMESQYFGADILARTNFFEELIRDRENYTFVIDGAFIIDPRKYRKDDYYLVLDHRLKTIQNGIVDFMESLDQCNAHLRTANIDRHVIQTSSLLTSSKGRKFDEKLSVVIANRFFPHIQDKLIETRNIIIDQIKFMDFVYLSQVVKNVLNDFVNAHKKIHPHTFLKPDRMEEIHSFDMLCREFQNLPEGAQQSEPFMNRLIEFIITDNTVGTLRFALNNKLQETFGVVYDRAKELVVEEKEKRSCQEEKTLVA